ncbi:MAG: tRNA lysidine(34) synthetase TilS [Christensenellales bacterium]|jgi:tRNA(Ile)-lysidine synthase
MDKNGLLSRVKEVLLRYHVDSGTVMLAAVSGGRDSVVLLDILCRLRKEMGFSLHCAHVNHHIRAEACDDAAFVADLCQTENIPFLLKDVDVPSYHRRTKFSPEAAARELRYRALDEAADSCGATWILTAHHADDQTETILLRFIRGAAPAGLCGMAEARGRLLRPMLDIRGEELKAYAEKRRLHWREDCTNKDLTVPRNALRYDVIPALEAAHHGAGENIRRAADRFRRDEDFFATLLQPILTLVETGEDGSRRLPVSVLAGQPPAISFRVLAALAWEEGLTEKHIVAVSGLLGKNKTGRQFIGPNGLRIQRERDMLIFTRGRQEPKEGTCRLQMGDFLLPDGCLVNCEEMSAGISSANTQYFDGDALPEEAVFRHPRPGDWMIPLGMQGRKKLGDIFTDAHFSHFSRCEAWVLAAGRRILWVPDLARIDDSVKLTDHTTRVLRITLR